MNVQYVTLTGADDSVDPSKLVEISNKFPHVEWAILFSQSKTGESRYPTLHWVDQLLRLTVNTSVNLSAHLCGKWVQDVFDFGFTFLNDPLYKSGFKRIQLNLGSDKLSKAIESDNLKRAINSIDQQVILGGNYDNVNVSAEYFIDNNCVPLFDSSGGRGILSKWHVPFSLNKIQGYAGGLGPDNIKEQLKQIDNICLDKTIWIDMESKLRTKEFFDLNKCLDVLNQVDNWMC